MSHPEAMPGLHLEASALSENTHKPRSSSSVAEDAKGADETHSVSGYVQMARAFPLRS